MPLRSPIVLLYLGLALLLLQVHADRVNFGPKAENRATRHEQVLDREGEAPWAWRVMSPALAEVTGQALDVAGFREEHAREYAYLAWRGLFTFGTFLFFHLYLGRWVGGQWPLVGTLLLAALHGPAVAWYWYQPDSPPDLMLWVLGALLTMQGRDRWLLPLMLVGAVNRETAIFILPIHVALRWGQEPVRELASRSLGLFLAWLAPILMIRAWVGPVDWARGGTPFSYLAANMQPSWLLFAFLFWGVLWLAPVMTWRRLPPALKRLLVVMIPYLALQLLFGRVREVRLFLPMGLALVPVFLLWARGRAGHGTGVVGQDCSG